MNETLLGSNEVGLLFKEFKIALGPEKTTTEFGKQE